MTTSAKEVLWKTICRDSSREIGVKPCYERIGGGVPVPCAGCAKWADGVLTSLAEFKLWPGEEP